MTGIWKTVLIMGLLLAAVVFFFTFQKKTDTLAGSPGEIRELRFELDKEIEFGEYYYDLDNGKGSTYPLCYCLTEKNEYPPDCSGDIKYIYSSMPGGMCVPLHIGLGRCSVKPISSAGYATPFLIPLEYKWTKPFEKIVMGIRIPPGASEGARLVIRVTIFKKDDRSELSVYRVYEKAIIVQQSKNNSSNTPNRLPAIDRSRGAFLK